MRDLRGLLGVHRVTACLLAGSQGDPPSKAPAVSLRTDARLLPAGATEVQDGNSILKTLFAREQETTLSCKNPQTEGPFLDAREDDRFAEGGGVGTMSGGLAAPSVPSPRHGTDLPR